MAFAFVTEWDEGENRDTAVYDQINASARVSEDRPAGMLLHSAGYTEDGVWRLFDVWETREQYEKFMGERIGPAMGQAEGASPPDRMYAYELHNVITS